MLFAFEEPAEVFRGEEEALFDVNAVVLFKQEARSESGDGTHGRGKSEARKPMIFQRIRAPQQTRDREQKQRIQPRDDSVEEGQTAKNVERHGLGTIIFQPRIVRKIREHGPKLLWRFFVRNEGSTDWQKRDRHRNGKSYF